MSYVQLSEGGFQVVGTPWLVVPVIRIRQSPTWIWLENYLYIYSASSGALHPCHATTCAAAPAPQNLDHSVCPAHILLRPLYDGQPTPAVHLSTSDLIGLDRKTAKTALSALLFLVLPSSPIWIWLVNYLHLHLHMDVASKLFVHLFAGAESHPNAYLLFFIRLIRDFTLAYVYEYDTLVRQDFTFSAGAMDTSGATHP